MDNKQDTEPRFESMAYQEWDEDKITIVKKEINNLIWMHSSSALTLEEADERACEILDLLRTKPKQDRGE